MGNNSGSQKVTVGVGVNGLNDIYLHDQVGHTVNYTQSQEHEWGVVLFNNRLLYGRTGRISEIHISDLSERSDVLISPQDKHSFNPVLSPKGSFIAFLSQDNLELERTSLYLNTPDGNSLQLLTPSNLMVQPSTYAPLLPYLDWSRDEKHIVFTARNTHDPDEQGFQLYSYELDTRRITQISTPDLEIFSPHFSDDGFWVVYYQRNTYGEVTLGYSSVENDYFATLSLNANDILYQRVATLPNNTVVNLR